MQKLDQNSNHNLKNKKATFLLACSVTKTCNISGITQAGIPGMIELTPTLDSEFLSFGGVKSLPDIASTPKGVPTPALITRAVSNLVGFDTIEFLDLGYTTNPQIENTIHRFDIPASDRIDQGANIDAKKIFEIAREFGKSYKSDSEYTILAETTPSGTTTAYATAKALGYSSENLFASTYKDTPSIKIAVVNKAIENIPTNATTFDKLSLVSDNMIIFYAGFILEAAKNNKLVLAGGTQMASVLLTLNRLANELGESVNSENISLWTTKWIYDDQDSDIDALLDQLSFKIDGYYADFDFALSNHPALKLYDDGEAKEGVGAGAAICYAYLNGISKEQLTKAVEELLA
jgi:uncharacterized protein (TIGR00303 family)